MKLLQGIAAFVLLLVSVGCGDNFPPTPTVRPTTAPSPSPSGLVPVGASFTAQYDTGSVPPPFNYTQIVEGSVEQAAIAVRYTLTYNFRDQIAPGQLPPGYSDHDDLRWSSRLQGEAFATWSTLLAETVLGPIPPLAPGSDSFSVTLVRADGHESTGVPNNRDAWQAAIAALDRQARAQVGNPRSQP